MRFPAVSLALLSLLASGPAAAQQPPRTEARPTPPPWSPPPNPNEPVCALTADPARGRSSPTVVFESRDNKVFLVVQSRPGETVALVTHENGAVSFDRPVCLTGIDAVVTKAIGAN